MAVPRLVTKDVELHGFQIKKGELVTLLLGSADTDDTEFPHAQDVDFERERNRHVAFGVGAHRCLGSHLARMELEVALEYFMDGNRQAWAHDPNFADGKPIRAGEYVASARGFMTELVAKSIKRGEFDKRFSDEDAEKIATVQNAVDYITKASAE